MSRRILWVGAVASVCGLAAVVWTFSAAEPPRPPVRHERDVEFARVGDVTLKLDLAMPPEGTGSFPAVVCIHGGGWVGGDRKQMAQTVEVLARRGYVAATIDYRLAPQHRFPACVEDCKAAVRWLRAHSGKYRIDGNRIAVVGLSAGGHLACLLGMTGPGDGLEGTGGHAERSSKVQAVVSLAGPTDLTAEELHAPEVLSRNLEPLLGGPPAKCPDAYRQASPVHYTPANPPVFLLVHGSADRVVPVRQAQALADKVRTAGGRADVVALDGEGHTWNGASLLRSIDQTLSFLDETLRK